MGIRQLRSLKHNGLIIGMGLLALSSLLTATIAKAEPIVKGGTIYDEFLDQAIADIVGQPVFLSTLVDRNAITGSWTNDEILSHDNRWRDGDQTLIRPVLDNPLSQYLAAYVANSEGVVAEIIVMDAKGCNVAVSSRTSDYWQGDEDKWLKTFATGTRDVFADHAEFDKSTGVFEQQLSKTIYSGDLPVGAITIGFDIRYHPSN